MKKLTISLFLLFALATTASAKWAPLEDAPTKNSYHEEITVNSDGTAEIVSEVNTEILNEMGRAQQASITLTYNEDSEKVEILDAKTSYQGKEYPLDKNLIEDKPLASSSHGFDQQRQILLAFPNTEVGAKIHLKYKTSVKNNLLKGFFGENFYFGNHSFDTNKTISISSQLPLNILVNDPEGYLDIKESTSNNLYEIKISLKRPIYKSVISESMPAILNPNKMPWVSISSLKSWGKFGAELGKLWTKVFTQKLPENFAAILKQAEEKNNDIDKINTVTSLLNDNVRYMGDWRTIEGQYIPRDLDKISKTQIGDCKDFSAATAAILSKLGFKAQIAVVMRGVTEQSLHVLPSLVFNHAMLKITSQEGRVYWIDPTNLVSMANGIFPDIAGKMILILDPENPSYEKIPTVNPASPVTDITKQLKLIDNNGILENGKLTLKNESAIFFTGITLRSSIEKVKDILFHALAGGAHVDNKNKIEMELPNLESRIVKDIDVTYSLIKENDILQTNVGPALKLNYNGTIPRIYNISEDFIADAVIDECPYSVTKLATIKNVRAKNIDALNQEITTPWLYVKRSCNLDKNNDLQVEDKIILYKHIIPSDDFKKPEFLALKNWLKNNFKNVIIVLETQKTDSNTGRKNYLSKLIKLFKK